MSSGIRKFTKTELEIYILLLCANSDNVESEEEMNMIKSKVDSATFENIYAEFKQDSEDESLEKIQDNINLHHYTNMELAKLRKEMYEIFFSDCDFKNLERQLDRIMDNIIY
ncbi:hypothetical protein SAMN03097699_0047 [Flavobacteriaceae bacterium MAR_2010_188]|nr:hypothetical protein SAMN03097699_0047 [Flavobacteriaceae bacterium MAR_2010_188]